MQDTWLKTVRQIGWITNRYALMKWTRGPLDHMGTRALNKEL